MPSLGGMASISTMPKPIKIGIIQFPGSNTERETFIAVRRAGMEPVEILWNDPVAKIHACDGYIIVGGFSYEDRSRAGVIASLEPIMTHLQAEAEAGKPVLGICNGAQILVEIGMIPGLENNRPGLALTDNRRIKDDHVLGTGYYNTWINLQLSIPPEKSAFGRHLKIGDWINVPIAHAEGRFVTSDKILRAMVDNDQTAFRYCDDRGNIINEFPVNPNGSRYNLAAVCNPSGNVMSIMPHPERTPKGDAIFSSMRDYIDARPHFNYRPLKMPGTFKVPDVSSEIQDFQKSANTLELTVELIISDNTASSVHNALVHRDIPVQVRRRIHWEIHYENTDPDQLLEQIKASGELFNSNKERVVVVEPASDAITLLIRNRDDVLGQQKLEALTKRFELDSITGIDFGVLWTVVPQNGDPKTVLQQVLDTHILYNPIAHQCYRYEPK